MPRSGSGQGPETGVSRHSGLALGWVVPRFGRRVPQDPPSRLLPIDALRGVAAISVLLFHLFRNGAMAGVLDGATPAPIQTVLDYGRSGVAIFFVISGFVIAYTTRNLGLDARDGLNFFVRRQVRLDPPYYLMLVLVIALGFAERLVPNLEYRDYSAGQFFTNMFYLQGFTGHEGVLAVAWTLCLEIQFYLFVVIVAVAVGSLLRRVGIDSRGRALQRFIFLAVGALSLASPLAGLDFGPWFIGLWWMFCMGMVVCWYMLRELSLGMTLGAMAGVGIWGLTVERVAANPDPWGGHWIAWATAVVILTLLLTGSMSRRPPKWLLFFGTISYSLYLVHLPIIDTVLGAGYKITGQSVVGAVVLCFVGGLLSIGAAWALQHYVERPAMQWSQRLKRVKPERVRDSEAASASTSP